MSNKRVKVFSVPLSERGLVEDKTGAWDESIEDRDRDRDLRRAEFLSLGSGGYKKRNIAVL